MPRTKDSVINPPTIKLQKLDGELPADSVKRGPNDSAYTKALKEIEDAGDKAWYSVAEFVKRNSAMGRRATLEKAHGAKFEFVVRTADSGSPSTLYARLK